MIKGKKKVELENTLVFRKGTARKALQDVLFILKDRLQHDEDTHRQVVLILRTQFTIVTELIYPFLPNPIKKKHKWGDGI